MELVLELIEEGLGTPFVHHVSPGTLWMSGRVLDPTTYHRIEGQGLKERDLVGEHRQIPNISRRTQYVPMLGLHQLLGFPTW